MTVSEAPVRALAVPIPKERLTQARDLANALDPIISEASQRFAIPEEWIRSVIRIESGGRTIAMGQPLISSAGAIGVMQLMAKTYNDLRLRHGLGSDTSDLRDNVLAGTAFLRELYKRYGYPSLFAAYKAGPA
jgi:soluble lytic murein transglycosylase-like protein